MKKKLKISALILSLATAFYVLGGTVTAAGDSSEEDYLTTPSGQKYLPRIVTVTAIKDDSADNGLINQGKYYLSDGCAVSEKELEKYCGEKTELEYGDTLEIHCLFVNSIIPGKYNWGGGGEEPEIKYLGKAADYYETKELTVKETENGVTFTDSEGKEYPWRNFSNTMYNPCQMDRYGYFIPEEFQQDNMKTGDKFVCALTSEICYDSGEPVEIDCVAVPVSRVRDDESDMNGNSQPGSDETDPRLEELDYVYNPENIAWTDSRNVVYKNGELYTGLHKFFFIQFTASDEYKKDSDFPEHSEKYKVNNQTFFGTDMGDPNIREINLDDSDDCEGAVEMVKCWAEYGIIKNPVILRGIIHGCGSVNLMADLNDDNDFYGFVQDYPEYKMEWSKFYPDIIKIEMSEEQNPYVSQIEEKLSADSRVKTVRISVDSCDVIHSLQYDPEPIEFNAPDNSDDEQTVTTSEAAVISSETSETTAGGNTAAKYGDVNEDGKINVSDVVALNLYLLNSSANSLSREALANADCVRDNNIDTLDGTLLMNYVAEIISYDELCK